MYSTPLCLKNKVAKKQELRMFNAIYNQHLYKNMKCSHDALGNYYSVTKMQTCGLDKEEEM